MLDILKGIQFYAVIYCMFGMNNVLVMSVMFIHERAFCHVLCYIFTAFTFVHPTHITGACSKLHLLSLTFVVYNFVFVMLYVDNDLCFTNLKQCLFHLEKISW